MTRPILLLDVMGTLVEDPFPRTIAAYFGMSVEALQEQKDPSAWLEFEHGTIEAAEMYRRFFADRRAVDGASLERFTFPHYRLLPGIADLLVELRAAGVPMHALSNYPVWYHAIEQRTRLSRFLSWSFVSCDTGHRKPDPESFLHPVRTLGVEPGRCVFVDDKERNTSAAEKVGVTGVVFTDAVALRARLVELGALDA